MRAHLTEPSPETFPVVSISAITRSISSDFKTSMIMILSDFRSRILSITSSFSFWIFAILFSLAPMYSWHKSLSSSVEAVLRYAQRKVQTLGRPLHGMRIFLCRLSCWPFRRCFVWFSPTWTWARNVSSRYWSARAIMVPNPPILWVLDLYLCLRLPLLWA